MIEYFLTTAVLFFIIAFRYGVIAGAFYFLLWHRSHKKKPLPVKASSPLKIRDEIKYSLISAAIFALPGAYMLEAWKGGKTLIYRDMNEYGWFYAGASLAMMLFIHDTYFYFTHRWLHWRRSFRKVHYVHHLSLRPTPWTSFSFHPWEAAIEALIIPVLVFVFPIHIGVLLLALTAMTFFSVVNHCGYEIYPYRWVHGWWGKVMITPTHHHLHHQRFDCNFGLYFRFWDQVMGTDVWEEREKPPSRQKVLAAE